MATLIPALSSCARKMTSGERRLAERLEDKLDDDYLCWYDVSIGERSRHPDFIVFHPSRGLLILEVKDWRLDTIYSMDKYQATILADSGLKVVANPLEQAREYMFILVDRLSADPQLIWPSGSLKGKPHFPYGHGVVFPNITRKQFDDANIGDVIPSHLVICKDEMTATVEFEPFQKRLWDMYPIKFKMPLSLPKIDRIRWHIFPEIRIDAQPELLQSDASSPELPDILRVMDIQQEQLARSLGEGHRVIHGVAGSGKTLILGYRAEFLAQVCQQPILVLCYNKTLANKLSLAISAKGLQDKVHVHNFHAWCTEQLRAFNCGMPARGADTAVYFESMVQRVIDSVDRKLIPSGQYDAVLVDEGHDFKPEWLKLIVQMVNPDTNSLLVLYDDAQSIYSGAKKNKFTFASVGIKAQGRTNILKLNYRNTAEILLVAKSFADDLLSPTATAEDEAPVVQPEAIGRHGGLPELIKCDSLNEELAQLIDRITVAHEAGMAWNEMAILYRQFKIGETAAQRLRARKIPFEWAQRLGNKFDPAADSVKLITMHSSKGLEFPLICIPGIGAECATSTSAQDEARLIYVAMTRATDRLIMAHSVDSVISDKLNRDLAQLA